MCAEPYFGSFIIVVRFGISGVHATYAYLYSNEKQNKFAVRMRRERAR